ncbi:MAG: hypothetical protein CL885_04655 [Dehalococcoidia bacterium]|nr:hypothetical protein [Dehalococcoidia bacterium]|tara:strand:+ start:1003 stop:1626 length:624 start_codon:yes stop_codon:yes gene_type:complete
MSDFIHGERERSFGRSTGRLPDLSKGSNPKRTKKREQIVFSGKPISKERQKAIEEIRLAKIAQERAKIKLRFIELKEKEEEREAKRMGFNSHTELVQFREEQKKKDLEKEKRDKGLLAEKAKEVEAKRRRRGGLTIREYCKKHGITPTSSEFKRRMATVGFRDEWIKNGKWIVDNSISPNDTRSIRAAKARGDVHTLKALEDLQNED